MITPSVLQVKCYITNAAWHGQAEERVSAWAHHSGNERCDYPLVTYLPL